MDRTMEQVFARAIAQAAVDQSTFYAGWDRKFQQIDIVGAGDIDSEWHGNPHAWMYELKGRSIRFRLHLWLEPFDPMAADAEPDATTDLTVVALDNSVLVRCKNGHIDLPNTVTWNLVEGKWQ